MRWPSMSGTASGRHDPRRAPGGDPGVATLRPTMTVSPDANRRLALIRLLLERAVQMSTEPPPFSFDSINRLHDAAEMFLALAAQEHGATIPKEFTGYWDALEKVGRPLSYRAQMQRFNKLRVGLKHYGLEPASADIVDARIAVSSLLAEECIPLFGVALNEVSLTAFIRCEAAKTLVDAAEEKWPIGDEESAMADISDAFNALIRDYEQRKMLGYSLSVFDNIKSITALGRLGQSTDRKQKEFNEAIVGSLEALDSAVMLVGLGVDFRQYGKFKALLPSVNHSYDGGRWTFRQPGGPPWAQADFIFCRDFVITTALHLAEFDYDIDQSPPLG